MNEKVKNVWTSTMSLAIPRESHTRLKENVMMKRFVSPYQYRAMSTSDKTKANIIAYKVSQK